MVPLLKKNKRRGERILSILRQFPRAFFSLSLLQKRWKTIERFSNTFFFFFLLIWLILLKEKKFLGIKKKKGTRTTIGRLCIFYYFFSF
jgi:hypothetical protein